MFNRLHRADVLAQPKYQNLRVGVLAGSKKRTIADVQDIPYGEAVGFWRRYSPYYNESHNRFRAAVRKFIDEEIQPTAARDDEDGRGPSLELNVKMGQAGLIAAIFGSDTKAIELYAPPLPGGLKVGVPA